MVVGWAASSGLQGLLRLYLLPQASDVTLGVGICNRVRFQCDQEDIDMALPDILPAFTPDEYLAFERGSESKHEYLDGLIYAMAGASPEHSTICVNVSEIITRQLRGTACRLLRHDPRG